MARYFLRFRHSDTGLTPAFNFFKKASDLSSQVAPPIGEVGSGTYYFDYSPAFDVVFEVDGGASIPTEEVRYISDTISPKDTYIDEPVSQVRTDVWTDSTSYASGQKGLRVDQIGDPTDTSLVSTVFGKTLLYKEVVRGDSAGSSDGENIKLARDRVMGGTGYGGTGVDVKTTYDRIGAPLGGFSTIAAQLGDPSGTNSIAQDIAALQTTANTVNTTTSTIDSKIGTPVVTVSGDIAAVKSVSDTVNAKIGTPSTTVSGDISAVKTVVDGITLETDANAIANAVWGANITAFATPGQGGEVMMRVLRFLANRMKINTVTNLLTVYQDDGTTPLAVFTLKDDTNTPNAKKPYERVP